MPQSDRDHLVPDALGTFESTIMGIAGTAPAFSVAATTATIVASVGVLSVGSILYCGLIMFGITLAFIHLSKITPNAGASYAWVGHVFGRRWGFFAGWGLLVASVFFMVSAAIPAATSTLALFAPQFTSDTHWVTGVSAGWLTVISLIVARGIKQSSYAQQLLTILESLILVSMILAAWWTYGGQPAHRPSLIWISPFSFTPQLFATGTLTAIFFYWGWDVTMNLSEESKGNRVGSAGSAGAGAFWAVLNMLLFFTLMMVVILIVLTDREIEGSGTNILFAVATKLFPTPWNYLAVFCTIFSTIGTIETQILQFGRGMFAMARDGVLHPVYGRIHQHWQTPWVATGVIWFLGVLLLFTASYLDSVQKILMSSILAIGIQICFYMSMGAFACAWHYRGQLNNGPMAAIGYVIWPLLSGMFLVFVALACIVTFDLMTNLLGAGGLLIGFLPLLWNAQRKRPVMND